VQLPARTRRNQRTGPARQLSTPCPPPRRASEEVRGGPCVYTEARRQQGQATVVTACYRHFIQAAPKVRGGSSPATIVLLALSYLPALVHLGVPPSICAVAVRFGIKGLLIASTFPSPKQSRSVQSTAVTAVVPAAPRPPPMHLGNAVCEPT
jgi:hypothetical protein